MPRERLRKNSKHTLTQSFFNKVIVDYLKTNRTVVHDPRINNFERLHAHAHRNKKEKLTEKATETVHGGSIGWGVKDSV